MRVPFWNMRCGAVLAVLAATDPATAQVPAGLRPIIVSQLDERPQGADLDSARPLTITLSQATPIAELLLMLVRDTRLSVVADPDVEGMFRGELKDVTLRQAFDLILHPQGLDYSVQGNLIRVFKRRVETRRFDLNALVVSRAGAADVFADLSSGVETLLSPHGRVNIDRKALLLQVTDYPDRLDQVQQYLEAVRARSSRQVRIQARVIEVALQAEFATGIDWTLLMARAGDAVLPIESAAETAAGLSVALHVRDFDRFLQALSGQGKVNVLASPTVTALNNETAVMRIVRHDVFFRTTTRTDMVTGRVVHRTTEPEPLIEGVVLSVTPRIADDGVVTLGIAPSLTERTGHATSRSGDTAPVLSVREAETVVRLREHETAVIAGLLDERVRRDVQKVPVLGDLPGLGAMFRDETTVRHKSDLVILLTPTFTTFAHGAAAAQPAERVSIR